MSTNPVKNELPARMKPPTALPDFMYNTQAPSSNSATKPGAPSTLSFVPPRPPVFNPELTAGTKPANPFAPAATAGKVEKPKPATVPVTTTARHNLPQEAEAKEKEKSMSGPPVEQKQPPVETKAASEVHSNVSLLTPPPAVESKELSSPATVDLSSPVSSSVEKIISPTSAAATRSTAKKEEIGEGRVDMSGGLMGWLAKTVAESKLLSDVAEKAKHGMEQVLTTLDPGMKGFLSDDGMVEVFTPATDHSHVQAIKEGFERVFARVLIRTVPTANGDFLPLVSGSAAALSQCRERANRLVQSKLAPPTAAVLTTQQFLMEIDGRTYCSTRLYLQWKEHQMDAIGQMLEVEDELMEAITKRSKADGKAVGEFSVTPSQVAKELYKLDCDSWAGPSAPFSFSELISTAAASVALQHMNLNIKLTRENIKSAEE